MPVQDRQATSMNADCWTCCFSASWQHPSEQVPLTLRRMRCRWTAQVFDGDIPYLYKQSRNNRLAFKTATGNDWVKEYFLPGQSDRCVVIPSI